MKIIFPELNTSQIAQKAVKHFPDINFLPAPSLDQAVKLLSAHEADSMISGLNYSSRDVLLAYKNHLPLESQFFTSCFICQKQNQTITIADGGVIKYPTREQLYIITEDTAKTFKSYTNTQPKIALLSYSTHGSGGQDSNLVKTQYVINRINKSHPDWLIDGELQLDAAITPSVSQQKSPDSPLRGQANILITPDLNSGNILYKSLERFGGFTVAGPLIQGFKIPLADLSRGSTVEDVILTINVVKMLLLRTIRD